MAEKWLKGKTGKANGLLIIVIFSVVALIGFSGIAERRNEAAIQADRFAQQFAKRLADALRRNASLENALASNSGCASELAALIVRQAALDQAQAEYDDAYQALEDCILEQPDPDPMPDPDPPAPETLPTNGEYSVLVP